MDLKVTATAPALWHHRGYKLRRAFQVFPASSVHVLVTFLGQLSSSNRCTKRHGISRRLWVKCMRNERKENSLHAKNPAVESQNEHFSKFNPSFLESMTIWTLLSLRVSSSSNGWKSSMMRVMTLGHRGHLQVTLKYSEYASGRFWSWAEHKFEARICTFYIPCSPVNATTIVSHHR